MRVKIDISTSEGKVIVDVTRLGEQGAVTEGERTIITGLHRAISTYTAEDHAFYAAKKILGRWREEGKLDE